MTSMSRNTLGRREILLHMYKSLIEFRLNYRSVAYGSVRKSRFDELEREQLAAIRIAYTTSPSIVLLCHALVPPLKRIHELQTQN